MHVRAHVWQLGVLFSLETTVAYYPVKTYYFAFLSSVMAGIYYAFMTDSPSPLQTDISLYSWVYFEMPVFILLGICCVTTPHT